jgi:hypothetical protein
MTPRRKAPQCDVSSLPGSRRRQPSRPWRCPQRQPAHQQSPDNGVAGYYSDGGGFAYQNLRFSVTTNSTTNNLVMRSDGIGGQLCNFGTGETAGIGLERTGVNLYQVFYGFGHLSGDPGAVFGPSEVSDANACLGGILPANNVLNLPMTAPIGKGDTVVGTIHEYRASGGGRRWHILFEATDLTFGDTSFHNIRLGKRVHPFFGQAGVGSQRSLANLTSPGNVNDLADFSGIWTGFPFFGCHSTTTQVNSAANANNDAAAEPNPFAQLDPANSLSGGCGGLAALTVFEGNPVS